VIYEGHPPNTDPDTPDDIVTTGQGSHKAPPPYQHSANYPSVEGCTHRLHPPGTPPGAILSPRSSRKIHSVFNLLIDTTKLDDEISTSKCILYSITSSQLRLQNLTMAAS
jgi:hypothetical protein